MAGHNFGTNDNNGCIHKNMDSYYLSPLWWKLQTFSPSSAFQGLAHVSHFEAGKLSKVRIQIHLKRVIKSTYSANKQLQRHTQLYQH